MALGCNYPALAYTGCIVWDAGLKIHLLSASILLAAAIGVRAQQSPATPPNDSQTPVPTLKIGTSLVSVAAVVLDPEGKPIVGLTKEDFVLKQDGKPQEIRYFSQDSDLPLTLALMVDTSDSQKAFIEDEIEASEKFFKAMMTRPKDRAMLIQLDSVVLQLQPLTTQVQTLENSLRYLSMPHAQGPGGTLLYDAIVTASQRFVNNERGRRAMVILTDGEDHGSRSTLEQAIAAAQRADIVVYSVLYSMTASGFVATRPSMAGSMPGTTPGTLVLEQLSKATGGRVFSVSRKSQLDQVYGQIADDMRLQYQIAYNPPQSKPGAYHKIELKPSAKHVTIEARQGYYSPSATQ